MPQYLRLLYIFVLLGGFPVTGKGHVVNNTATIVKYKTDTVGFSPIELKDFSGCIYSLHPGYIGMEGFTQRKFDKGYRRLLKKPVANLYDTCMWLQYNLANYVPYKAFVMFLREPEFKQVDEGFLIMGQKDFGTDIILPYPKQKHIETFFVGFDHRVARVRCDTLQPPARHVASFEFEMQFSCDQIPDTPVTYKEWLKK